tara:strand:- start:4971 stop:5369 length:399 start_codon:yes stop_codon:yes gene_type:complete
MAYENVQNKKTVILPRKKPRKTKENTVYTGTVLERGKRATKAMLGLADGKVNRGAQFANYLAMIDRLSKKRVNLARGFVADPGEKLTATSGQIGTVGRNVAGTSVSMSNILDEYHDRALRLAQAKYYQKQVG